MTDVEPDGIRGPAETAPDLPIIEDRPKPSRGASSLLRSSAVMALGTVASRLTGFIRTTIIVIALGTHALGDVYNTANTIPNILYDLLLGGVLTAVHVPMLVRAREKDLRYGEEYEARLLTIVLGGLLALTAIAMVAAPLLIDLYGSKFTGQQHDLAVIFSLFFLPQIFFYGVGALIGASLNARGSFAAPMWTPVLNNLVVSVVGVVFLFVAGPGVRPETITNGEITLIALGTTAGIVLQTIALVPALRKVGFRFRPRFDFRREELAPVGGMAMWTLVYVGVMQIGLVVNTNIANGAGARGLKEGIPYGVGLTPWTNAYQLFQLPYAIVAVSVITALLPRMSEHAAERRLDLVRDDMSSAMGLSSTVIVPAAALLFALGAEITTLFFAHGSTKLSDALMIANVLQAFAITLVPFAVFQLLLRVFYALADTRTPALISIGNVAISITLGLICYNTLPVDMIVEGIAIALGISWAVGCVVAVYILRGRLGRLNGRHIVNTHVRIAVATVPTLVFAFGVHALCVHALGRGMISALAALIVGGSGGAVLYVLVARRLHIQEVETLYRTVMARLPGRVSG